MTILKFDRECYSLGTSKWEPGIFVTTKGCSLEVGDTLNLESHGLFIVEELEQYKQEDCCIARVVSRPWK